MTPEEITIQEMENAIDIFKKEYRDAVIDEIGIAPKQ